MIKSVFLHYLVTLSLAQNITVEPNHAALNKEEVFKNENWQKCNFPVFIYLQDVTPKIDLVFKGVTVT